MIESLSIRNFKVLREVDVDLKPLTVIVGPNASGKSSVLHALKHLTQLREIVLSTQQPEPEKTKTKSEYFIYPPLGLLCSKVASGRSTLLQARCMLADDTTVTLKLEIKKGGMYKPTIEVDGEEIDGFDRILVSVLLALDVAKLRAPSYPKHTSLRLPEDGDGLSSVLAGIYLADISRHHQIIEQTRKIIPGLRDIRIRQVPMNNSGQPGIMIGYQVFFDMEGAKGIPAQSVSDGTLLTLALVTALSAPKPPDLVMIDDIERGFHPRALKDLVNQLRSVQSQNPELQIVVTSHSPYLLDFFEAGEILLTSFDEEGYSTVQPLVNHPEYERWKSLMAPGEFWSSVGEDWITKEKKATAR